MNEPVAQESGALWPTDPTKFVHVFHCQECGGHGGMRQPTRERITDGSMSWTNKSKNANMHTCGSSKHTWVSKDGLQAINAVPDAPQRIELDKSGRTLRARGLATAIQTGSQLVTVVFVFTRSSIDVHDYLSTEGMLLYIAYPKGSAKRKALFGLLRLTWRTRPRDHSCVSPSCHVKHRRQHSRLLWSWHCREEGPAPPGRCS